MTGQEMFEKALKLLNYTEPDGSSDSSLVMRALSVINACSGTLCHTVLPCISHWAKATD